jgi:uncharacterized membrane protein YhaH (DUF805 family)
VVKRLARVFSFNGRSSRLAFWRTTVTLLILSGVVEGISVAGTFISPLAGAAALALFVPLLIANFAIAVRRFHDRGKSGWWIVLLGIAPPVLGGIAEVMGRSVEDTQPARVFGALGLLLTAFVLTIWCWIELGFLRGKAVANRFGAPV